MDSNKLIHPRVGLRKSHRRLIQVKRGLFFKRQNQLTDLAEALVEDKGMTDVAQLKKLQNRENGERLQSC